MSQDIRATVATVIAVPMEDEWSAVSSEIPLAESMRLEDFGDS
jgi:hypothetical protein